MDFETNDLMWAAFKIDASPAQSFPELKLKAKVLAKFGDLIDQSIEADSKEEDE